MVVSLGAAMLGSAAIGAGGSIIGGMMSSSKSNAGARQLQRMQIKWERERAKNAHQWEMYDLKKAGLNPALTATGGSGASTSGVSGAMPDYSQLNSGISNASNIIANSAKQYAELKNAESQTNLNEAQAENVNADTTSKTITNSNLDKSQKIEIKNKEAQIRNMDVDTRYQQASFNHRLTEQIGSAMEAVARGKLSQNNAEFLESYGISREEALALGAEGIRQIGGLIQEGMSLFGIAKRAKELLKLKQGFKGGAGHKK